MTAYSILDLAPVPDGSTPADALGNSVDLAQHAEQWGYTRYWFAEHHNSTGIASAATSIMIGHVAGKTNTIRVGAGASCCRTTRRSWWPNSSERLRRYTPTGSTLVWAARRARIWRPRAPCGGSCSRRIPFPRMWSNSWAISNR